MTPARMRRLSSDYEEVKKNFAGHKNIIVTPIGDQPPEKYHVTYFVNGIYLLPDGRIETLGRHEVDIILHAEYPRYKPICRISTPIWHPNFRDGQICIGDIWGAGESLSDIIVNIGDMIQYKSWNSYSPLSADAAQWAIENKHLFPVGTVELFYSDYASAKDEVEIDLFDDSGVLMDETAPIPESQRPARTQTAILTLDAPPEEILPSQTQAAVPEAPLEAELPAQTQAAVPDAPLGAELPADMQSALFTPVAPSQGELPAEALPAFPSDEVPPAPEKAEPENDFEITAEELAGIEFIPTAQRMQTVSHAGTVKAKVNFKTVLQKGILWALLGALLGFLMGELLDGVTNSSKAASLLGYSHLSKYFEYQDKADEAFDCAYDEFKDYCRRNKLDPDEDGAFVTWVYGGSISSKAEEQLSKYLEYDDKADDELYDSYRLEFDEDTDALGAGMKKCVRVSTGLWSAIIAMCIGLLLGIGEGVFYGSAQNALKFGLIGAGVSLVLGFISGDLAQRMYSSLLGDDSSLFVKSLVRGLGWAVMGVGVGLAIGLIRPNGKRILFCTIGGFAGAFIGGFLFNYVLKIVPNVIVARGVGTVLMGVLIGVGVGLLEQFAKQAWLKVIRGEFEGKEYLVFTGTTSIGNNGKNTIVLFKDKLVGPHHCDIVMEGSKYVLVDCGTPLGTIVNGNRTSRHVLRQGDAIAIGNSVLVFNTK